MNGILSIAATGMRAQEFAVEVASNDIANLETPGYKEHRAEFHDLMYNYQKRPGSQTSPTGNVMPAGISVGAGVKIGSVYRIHTNGRLDQTGNDTDVAIKGKGYFRVELPNGDFGYTRDGIFSISPQGVIVNSQGFTISPGIIVPDNATKITINNKGEVFVKLPDQVDEQLLGQFDLISFVNDKGLEEIGDNIYLETTASGAPIVGIAEENGMGTILQGWIESSNIEIISKLTDMIKAQRAYEFGAQFIQAGSEMGRKVTELRT